MKRLNKIALALGTVATVAAPVAAIVSCGSTSKKVKPGNLANQEENTTPGASAAETSLKKNSGYEKLSRTQKATFDEELSKAEQLLKDAQGFAKMSKADQEKFNEELAKKTLDGLKEEAQKIEDKIVADRKAKEEAEAKKTEEEKIANEAKKDSAFYSEENLAKAIKDEKTDQILKDLKRLNFNTIKNFMDTTDLKGTKNMLKALVGSASKITKNLFPLVDRVLAGLKTKVNLNQKYVELYKKITTADGAGPLFDTLGSQLAVLLDGEIDKYVTQDLIDQMKSGVNKYLTQDGFDLIKPYLDKIDYSTWDKLGSSIFGLIDENKDVVVGLLPSITKLIPQLQFVVNMIDPASKAADDAKKADAAKNTPVKEYKLEFDESGKMTLLTKDDSTKTTPAKPVAGTPATAPTASAKDVDAKPSLVTTILNDFFDEADPQNLIGGKSDKFNRIIMTVLSIIGKQSPETIAQLKEILLSSIVVDYKLKADWNYDGVTLKAGTPLNIEQLETFFMNPSNNKDKDLSPFVEEIAKNMGIVNPNYDKAYVPKMEKIPPKDGLFDSAVQVKINKQGDEILDVNNKPIPDPTDYTDPILLDGHIDANGAATVTANKLYEETDKTIFAKGKILGTETTLEGVKLSDYGFKDVDAFAKVFGSTEHFGQTIDLPSELLMVRKGIKVGYHKIDILKIGIGVPASADFGTGIFKNILSTKPEDLEYSKSIAKTLGLDPEEFEKELTEYYRKATPKTINKFEAGAFKTGQPTPEIFAKLGSPDYNAALKLMFKAAYSHVETNNGKTIQDPSDPTKTIPDPLYNWDDAGHGFPEMKRVNHAILAAKDLNNIFNKGVEDSQGNQLLTCVENGKTTPIGANKAFGLLTHDLLLFLQMSRDWLNTANHGDFEAFYKAKVETQTQTVSIRAHQKAELQDATNHKFDTLRKVIESFQTGLEDVFGKATEADRDGKALLE